MAVERKSTLGLMEEKQVSLWLVAECQEARVTRTWLTGENYFQ